MASGLCLARKFLLGTEKWESQGCSSPSPPTHTHTPSPFLTEASGDPQELQGKGDHLTGWGQSSEPIVGKLPAHPGVAHAPTSSAPLGGCPCTVNPQEAQNLLVLSGPGQFQQYPAPWG